MTTMTKRSMITPHAVACAAKKTLADEGLIPAACPDAIADLEEEIGLYPMPSMSAAVALKMAKGEGPLPQTTPPIAFAGLGCQIKEEMGMAARKGKEEIPPAIWARMKVDRKNAEDERARKKS